MSKLEQSVIAEVALAFDKKESNVRLISRLEDLGDSLDVLTVASQLESRFEINIDDEDLQKAETVADLVRLVEKGLRNSERVYRTISGGNEK